jgi:uncharacterized RDD family membrane protein YckC
MSPQEKPAEPNTVQSTKDSKQIPPGWYADPIDPQIQRYWDGEQWIDTPHSRQVVTSSPAADQASTHPVQVARLAPLNSRFAARIIDFGILLGLNIIVNGWFIYQYFSEIIPIASDASREYQANGKFPDITIPARAERLSLLITVIMLLLWLAYELPGMINTGQTVGKKILGIKVVDITNGQNPRFLSAFRRWFIFAFPLFFSPICAAPIMAIETAWCLWDKPARQCLHDKFAHTIVVRAQEPKNSKS